MPASLQLYGLQVGTLDLGRDGRLGATGMPDIYAQSKVQTDLMS